MAKKYYILYFENIIEIHSITFLSKQNNLTVQKQVEIIVFAEKKINK